MQLFPEGVGEETSEVPGPLESNTFMPQFVAVVAASMMAWASCPATVALYVCGDGVHATTLNALAL
jgi:hypothetical protein